ncbi:MAG: hypothetical protein QMC40_07855 [Vicingaceae bacterium]|jgi:hypothetical protein
MKQVIVVFGLLLAMCNSNELLAQPPPPGGGGGDSGPNCFPPPCVPIDGGLSWLLIAGTVYGGKKLYKANKEQKEEL